MNAEMTKLSNPAKYSVAVWQMSFTSTQQSETSTVRASNGKICSVYRAERNADSLHLNPQP